MGLPAVEGEGRSLSDGHGAIGKLSQRPRKGMNPLAAALDAFGMQDGVHRFGGRARSAASGHPRLPEPHGSLAPAAKARPMAGREGDSLIEEEQFCPAPPGHDSPAAAFVLTAAGEPGFGGPAPVQQGLRRGVVDDAAIAGE
jgi:hypothetical protein